MYTYYKIDMPDSHYSHDIQFRMNEHVFSLSFVYSDELYQLWRQFEQNNTTMAKGDPLVTVNDPKLYKYDYTYIEYYTGISSATGTDLTNDVSSWLSSQEYLPASILRLDATDRVPTIVQRILACRELVIIRNKYKDLCRWYYVMMIDGELADDGYLELWGWRRPNERISFKFTADIDYIGYDDLGKVGLYVRVNNG